MIILDGVNEKIQIVLGGTVTANQLQWQSSYAQLATTDLETYDGTDGTSNNTTDVDVVTGVASKQMLVKSMTFYNADTAAVTLTVKKDISGTERILYKGSLAAGAMLHYEDGQGWTTFANDSITNLQVFTTPGAGTWNKPTSFTPTFVRVIAYGGGGGGGGGSSQTGGVVRSGGCGGGCGGGATVAPALINATAGGSAIVTGAGGGAAGTSGAAPTAGTAGTNGGMHRGGNGGGGGGGTITAATNGGAGGAGGFPAGGGGGGGVGSNTGTGGLGGVGGTGAVYVLSW